MNLMNVVLTIYLIFIKVIVKIVDFGKLKKLVSNIKIKDNRSGCKIAKFTLKMYTFVYRRLKDFLGGRFDYETLRTINFFVSVHQCLSMSNYTCIIHT